MKGQLVCFLLLGVTFGAATEEDADGVILHEQQGQVEQQTPEPPTDDPSGQKQQGETDPPTYGQCPPTTLLPYPTAYCLEDGPCPGDEKCCQIGNIRKCVLPKGVNEGYCPGPQDQAVYRKSCAGDHECGFHEKCCRTDGRRKCVQAVPGAPGLCPETRLPRVSRPCENQCEDDRLCASGKKCCFVECGLKCVDPERAHLRKHQEQDRDRDLNLNQNQNLNQVQGTGAGGSCCPLDWLPMNGLCYKVFSTVLTWDDAEMFCRKYKPGCNLASIHSQAESVELAKYISDFLTPKAHIWIGLRDTPRNDTWVWSDGSATNYTSWRKGQPDHHKGKEFCVEIVYFSGYLLWNDTICENRHPFLCQCKY